VKSMLLLLALFFASCNQQPSLTESFAPVQTITPATTGRYLLIAPKDYAPYIPRAEKFFREIQKDTSVLSQTFLSTHATGELILATIASSENFTAKVTTYGWWKDYYSAAIASTVGDTISLNKYKLNRDACSIINTLVHEYMHRLGFTHASNSVKGQLRDMSVPYWFGGKAEEYCKAGKV
jgi:hypothetical protein